MRGRIGGMSKWPIILGVALVDLVVIVGTVFDLIEGFSIAGGIMLAVAVGGVWLVISLAMRDATSARMQREAEAESRG
jgi:hypothetical protein